MMLLLAGCMTMDPFFIAGTPEDAYVLGYDVIPETNVEQVSFETEDAATLYGVWAHQDDPDAQTFLYFHGNTDNIDLYWHRVEFYWEMGLNVFIFDYRGFGMSPGSSDWDSLALDGQAAIHHVEETTGLDASDIVYHGLSLGGSVAIRTAVTDPPKVLITEDMFASAQKIINDGSGQDMPAGWFMADEWDNVAVAPDVHVPYFVMHAEDDTFVRSNAANLVYDAANDPKRLWLAPGCDHDTTPDILPDQYRDEINCWIAQDCADP
jgi:alpha-beta hydrolase superfamily lysophospholipase